MNYPLSKLKIKSEGYEPRDHGRGASLGKTITWLRAVVPNLGPPDVLQLQLPEILASRGGGEGLWEL